MLFNTIQFGVFFFAVFAMYFSLPYRFRCIFLLGASYYFYMCWSVKYISVIIGITVVDYYAGIKIEAARGARRRMFLAVSIISNFGLLFVFKYADFFSEALAVALRPFGAGQIPLLHWILPVGISFHTFQAVSYTFDVYREKAPAERNLLRYALYVAFFPQMVAGPIERPENLLPQFRKKQAPDYGRIVSGLKTALWGLIKKSVVADLASPVVNTVYSHPKNFSGTILAMATILFSVQIYCDFSGYSDIAIGVARILGFDLMVNFRQPYFAQSIREFWQRWHISLSSWFRDYLYIPLGGNHVAIGRWVVNVMIVFVVSGLWHGANWTFVAWGLVHGGYILAANTTQKVRLRLAECTGLARLPRIQALARIAIMNLLVTFAWIFFRAVNLKDALYIASHIWNITRVPQEEVFSLGLPRFEMMFLIVAIAGVFACEYLRQHPPLLAKQIWQRPKARWLVYGAAIYTIVFFGVFQRVEFIYFQF